MSDGDYAQSDHESYVCPACLGDAALKEFIESKAENEECSFCGATSDEAIAAPLDDLVCFMADCLFKEYDDPVNCMGIDDGEFIGNTFDSHELLYSIDLELPNDHDGKLFSAIARLLGDHPWCDRDPYGMSRNEKLHYSWQAFCDTIKHRRRFFFLEDQDGSDRDLLKPSEVLRTIFEYCQNIGLVRAVPRASIKFFRARLQRPGETLDNVLQLGPPPHEAARQSRMSPAGIVMMYVSEDAGTALAETVDQEGTYVVGEFVTERDALILDLAELPETPSIFYEVPDSMEYDPRQNLIFLHHIAREISRPIARDDRVHVEYVPTQVVTEFFRTVATQGGSSIDGIVYRSSRQAGKSSMVLFADQTNMIPEDIRDKTHGFHKDRWIRLVDKQEYEISNLTVDYDVRPVYGRLPSADPE
jgi:hypothetical protein